MRTFAMKVAIVGAVLVGPLALAPSAAADGATVCGSATVVVNGSPVLDEATCQTLPPE